MMAKRGAKPKTADWETVDRLCGIQCTIEEIADWLDVDLKTLDAMTRREKKKKNFSEYYRQKRGAGKISLRRRQWQAAQEGNSALLIFLGKNYLGQADRIEEKVEAKVEDSQVIKEQRDLIEELKQINEKWRK